MVSQKGFAPIVLILVTAGLLALIGAGYYLVNFKSRNTTAVVTNNRQIPLSPTTEPITNITTKMGNVSGKLCYPSESVPAGRIEAKSLTNGILYTQDYPGSHSGVGVNYNFSLPADSYNLRFELGPSPGSFGYHTTVCPTGSETTCGDNGKRKLIPADLNTTGKVINFDLCDFYYQLENAPDF